jgi:hypothetical protein
MIQVRPGYNVITGYSFMLIPGAGPGSRYTEGGRTAFSIRTDTVHYNQRDFSRNDVKPTSVLEL